MKLTQYLFIIPTNHQGKYALYNSFSNTIAIIDEELKAILESEDFSALPQEHITSLKQLEVIREDDADELKMLEYKKKSLRFASDKTEFFVIPTYKCNLKCPGCPPRENTMNEDVVKNTIEAIKRETREKKSNYLWLYILGGEPLLEPEITYKISKELSEWAKDENIMFYNTIITNGTLFTDTIIDQFFQCITSVQVSLEGPAEYHNKKRVYKNKNDEKGRGTFEDIVNSVLLLKKNNIHAIINVPVTRENCHCVPEFVEYLKNKGITEGGAIHIRLFLSKGVSNGVCAPYSPLCNEGDADAPLLMDVWEKVWKKGFRATAKPTQTPYCSGIKDSVYAVDPEGNVYKCLSMVGNPDERVAVLKDGVISAKTPLFYELLSRDATRIEKCNQCKYLPLCAGGCPTAAKTQHHTYHAPDCGQRKTLFDKRIELFLRFKHPTHFGVDEGVKTPNV
ncbi:MAG: SPASM domain-containing protein [Theionarchaea archaeon]|nr:MAG: hypothetical protein AYK18_02540 [Theionarchaea archaeon DG-70]MBU7012129.1 SPASM domain-containing protein [Theionarchaea archaeon]